MAMNNSGYPMGDGRFGSNPQDFRGLNKAVKPECLYCDRVYTNMGPMRVHLRKHLGMRPYKCATCDYKHWDKGDPMKNHVILTHGRKFVDEDIVTLTEVDKQLTDMVEQGIMEIRDIQIKKKHGEKVTGKKSTPREIGQVFRGNEEENYSRPSKRSTNWDVDTTAVTTTPKNNESSNNETKTSETPLASKLSQAYNNNKSPPISNQTISSGNYYQNQNNVTTTNGSGNFTGSYNYSYQGYSNQTNTNVPTGNGQIYGQQPYNNQSNMNNQMGPGNLTAYQNPHFPGAPSHSPPKGASNLSDVSLDNLLNNNF